ncbi:MAG TPA: heme ABC transporter ATP-binding protein [Puia sp.]|jgi:iron complex transport system ATP-binding protein|nr:heme ABC transporter ATP-binding protein [Puia sp.]
MLRIEGLGCQAGGKPILQDISIQFLPGLLHVIVGPNGSGKSTFLKAFGGEWPVATGEVYYDGTSLRQLSKTELSRRRAVMSQLPELHFPFRVDDIVMMGRYPHYSFSPSRHDTAACHSAMDLLSVLPLADRDYLTLSGGERQRVQFARALTQIWDPPGVGCRYLFLDEPVSSLDIRYQHQLLGLVRSLVKEDTVIIAVLHDLNLAVQYADRILFLKEGRVAAEGAAPAIVKPDLIREVFGVEAHILQNPFGRQPVIVYG